MSSFDEIASGGEFNNWPVPADHGPSFAQMLRTNDSRRTVAWPSLSRRSEPTAPAVVNQDSSNVDPELEEYIPPAYSQSLGEALAQALEKSELLKAAAADNVTSSKKKKKKGKTTVLFATNMARAS